MNEQDKLSALELRISNIESELKSLKILSGQTSRSTSETSSSNQSITDKPRTIQATPPNSTNINSGSKDSDNSKFFGIVASICFLLAASYFIKYTIDSGWLTPLRQVGGAFLFGFTLTLTSLILRTNNQKYSSILAGTGIAIIYMSAYAGHMYYDLYNIYLAVFFVNLVSLGCIYLFYKFRETYYAIAAILGTYLVPVIFLTNELNIYTLTIYFIFWGLAYSLISIGLKNRLFIGIISYLGISAFFFIATNRIYELTPGDLSFIVGFQATQFVLFLIATILYSLKVDNPLSSKEAWSLFPALLIFYATEYFLIYRINSAVAPWLAVLFGFLTIVAYFFARRALPDKVFNSLPMLATYLAFITLHAGYLNLVPSSLCPWFALCILFFTLKIPTFTNDTGQYWPAKLILTWIFVGEILKSLAPNTIHFSILIINFGFAVGLLLFAKESENTKQSSLKSASEFIYLLAIIELLCGEKHSSEYFLSYTYSSLVTSIAWGATALLFLSYAKKTLSKNLATTSMVIFAIVAYKVLFMDLSSSNQGAKIISLVILGSLFYYAGYIYKNLEGTRPID